MNSLKIIEQQQKIWIVVPAYNEEATIGQVIIDLCAKGYSILVIDDCSTDKTPEIASQFPVIVLQHMINLGQGAALQTGFDYLLSHTTAKYVVTFDSDRQHKVEEIQLLLEPITTGNFDVALGTRFSKNTNQNRNINGMPFSKFLTLKVGVFFTRLTTRLNITDTHNGFRGFSIEALRKIHVTQNRMAHGSEILMQIAKNKFSYCEVPVSVVYTEYSKKKGQKVFNSLNILWDLIFGREE
jgi:glycosyltransferase involved in cell wall biosynthesis